MLFTNQRHRIPAGKALSQEEQAFITDVFMDWIEGEGAIPK